MLAFSQVDPLGTGALLVIAVLIFNRLLAAPHCRWQRPGGGRAHFV